MFNLIGFILPPLIDLINGKMESKYVRFWVSVAVCVLVGMGVNAIETNGFKGYLTVADCAEGMSKSVLSIFGIAQLVYQAGYGDSSFHNNVRSKAIISQ